MLLWLFHLLTPEWHFLRVFQYLTFRAIVSSLTALLMLLLLGPHCIAWFKKLQLSQTVRNDGPESHLKKTGTPTMGGLLILLAVVTSVLLWGDLSNRYLWAAVSVMVAFGFVGGVDDYLKVVRRSSEGLSARWKFLLQSLLGMGAAVALYCTAASGADTQLVIPFFKDIMPQLGVSFVFLTYFVLVGTSNAVNLTDGLDGLALMPVIFIAIALSIFAYLSGNVVFAKYLHIPYLPGVGELVVFCSALVGAGLGFLWYNTYPAQIFMGDVGSLSLGAALGILAVLVRQELVFFLMGGVFVMETVSVILQVASFKLTGRRIFRMAPLHHHFELKGWSEPKIIVRFWIITVILVLLGLATLKLR